MQIAPLWSSLLSDPGARLQAKAMNGTLAGVVQKSGALSAEAAGLRFDLPLQEPLPCNITGTLSEAQLDTVTGLNPDTKTSLSLRLNNVMIIGLASLDADNKGIALGEITLQAEGQGRNMQIKSLAAKGGVLDVGGEGTLLVGRSAATSRIKLTLQVRPGPNANPNITSLLQLAGEAGCRRPLYLAVIRNPRQTNSQDQEIEMLKRILICAILVAASAALPAWGVELTPFAVRNFSPPALVHGLPVAETARVNHPGQFSSRLGFDISNIATDDDRSGENIVLDGETYVATFGLRYGLAEHLQVGIDLPWVWQSKGFLDGFIENFHDFFGMPNADRNNMSNNNINYAYDSRDGDDFLLDHETSGIGDVRLLGSLAVAG